MSAWLFLKGVFQALMRVSVPLLLAGIVLMAVSGCLIWKWGVADRAWRKAEAKVARLDDSLQVARRDLAICAGSIDRLTASLEAQNALVDALRAEGDARTRRANAAIRRANEQARGLRARIDRLERARPSGELCESARSLIVEALREDRP